MECKRCGKKIWVKESVQRSTGPVCWHYILAKTVEDIQRNLRLKTMDAEEEKEKENEN